MPDISVIKQKVLHLADHCVKCGLCSAQCPTYLLKQDENESPRGRISLAQAIASDAIPPGGKISEHLDNCLQCRRCEAACPSEVQYGELIKYTNILMNEANQLSQLQLKAINFISGLTHKNWQKIISIYPLLSSSGLTQLLKLNKSGKKLFSFLPKKTKITQKQQPDIHTNNQNAVFLFTGCLSHILDNQSLQACISLLNLCGYKVNIPDKQTCCGAIAARKGIASTDQKCQIDNIMAFSDTGNTPVLFFTTGCGSKLKEYQENLPSEVHFADRTTDITRFLNSSDFFKRLEFAPLRKKVLIFNPCSERNVLKQTDVVENLLRRIPNIELINLSKNTGCCGASGSHFFTHQQQAEQIRQPVLNQILDLSPDIIVSPNYPCSLHIQAGLREKNLDIDMMHPIELLLKQVTKPE